jgi:glycosyltransferase involved in cell wall biosynthesis
MTCGFMGLALRAGGYRGPIIGVEHGDVLEVDSYGSARKAAWRATRAGAARADSAEVAVSDFVLAQMERYPRGEVRRIYNGVDLERFRGASKAYGASGERERVVGMAGRLIRGKGADHLIEAIARLRPSVGVRLVIAGDGPDRPRLEEMSGSLGLRGQVDFVGLVHDMPKFWSECDVAAVPSAEFIESCPMVVLEAMASGRPVVATINGGIPELVADGVSGTLVPPGDSGALAQALNSYFVQADLAAAHGGAGVKRVTERFDLRRCAQAYLALLEEQHDKLPKKAQ